MRTAAARAGSAGACAAGQLPPAPAATPGCPAHAPEILHPLQSALCSYCYHCTLVPAHRARCVAANSRSFPSSFACLGTFSTNGMSIPWDPSHPHASNPGSDRPAFPTLHIQAVTKFSFSVHRASARNDNRELGRQQSIFARQDLHRQPS